MLLSLLRRCFFVPAANHIVSGRALSCCSNFVNKHQSHIKTWHKSKFRSLCTGIKPDEVDIRERIEEEEQKAEELRLRMEQIAEYYSQYEKEYSELHNKSLEQLEEEMEQPEEKIVSLPRGSTGVFDIHELVDWLQTEKALDIAVLRMPPALMYCDYQVLVSTLSYRHMKAIMQHVVTTYKAKRGPTDPVHLRVQGERDGEYDWRAVDMGNIVLHVMKPSTREKYDIETLWTVGPELDDRTHEKTDVDKWEELLMLHSLSKGVVAS